MFFAELDLFLLSEGDKALALREGINPLTTPFLVLTTTRRASEDVPIFKCSVAYNIAPLGMFTIFDDNVLFPYTGVEPTVKTQPVENAGISEIGDL